MRIIKFSKMFLGDFKRQIMKQPLTKKQKFRFWTKRRANNINAKSTYDLAAARLVKSSLQKNQSVLRHHGV